MVAVDTRHISAEVLLDSGPLALPETGKPIARSVKHLVCQRKFRKLLHSVLNPRPLHKRLQEFVEQQ